MVTFAKLQELMTTRPVTFPGLPVLFIAGLLGGIALAGWLVSDPRVWVGVLLCLLGLLLVGWRALADSVGIATAVVVFDTDAAECRRPAQRGELPVRADVVANQLRRWPTERDAVLAEPWTCVLWRNRWRLSKRVLAAGSRWTSERSSPAPA